MVGMWLRYKDITGTATVQLYKHVLHNNTSALVVPVILESIYTFV